MVVRKNSKVKKCHGIEEGSVSVDLRTILLKSKGGKVRSKLTEVEEIIFGGDSRGGCMQK